MGVPYYFYVITQAYEGILLQHLPDYLKCHHFMLDFNGLIHPSTQQYLKGLLKKQPKDLEKGIMSAIWNDSQNLIKLVQPQKTVQIYIDGVAPLAKMNQQRKRRFMSVYRKKALGEESLWDSNAISPATTFMTRLHASIKAHIRCSKAEFTYYFSSADEEGEGEHKIFEKMANQYNQPDEVKVIYGMDADLIMLSLFSHLPNIYLLRENQHSICETDKYLYLDIDKLRLGIIKDLKHTYNWCVPNDALNDTFSSSAKNLIESYAVVCFLLGNDFLPHPISINLKKGGLQHILKEAGKIWKMDTQMGLNWSFLSQLLEMLSQYENYNIYNVVLEHSKNRAYFATQAEELEAYPLINRDPFEKDFLHKIDQKQWRTHYYKYLFNSNDTSVISSSCELYLKGILWTYLYYKRLPKDDLWYYPYGYSPTLKDVSNYINSQLDMFEKMEAVWKKEHPKNVFCEPIVQLLSILPQQSVDCIPPKYRDLMLKDEGLRYLYPDEYNIQTFMKTKLWECHLMLPPMNVSFVKKIVATIK